MRKILVIILFVFTSCEPSLDIDPKMLIHADVAFNTKANVYAALIGCYDALQFQHYYGRNLIIIGDLLSDNSIATGTKIEYYSVEDNNLLSDNILVEGIWTDVYSAVNRVNYMLYKLDKIDFLSDIEKKDYIGQLKFLRALHYYNLVRLYGNIPLKTEPTIDSGTENFLPRSSVTLVYNLIVSDLEFASQNIKNIGTEKATVNAAKALLASVYLTLKDYSQAVQYASEVIAGNSFLEENYADLFANRTEPSKEIIFYIPFNPSDKNRLAEYHFPNQLGGRYENSPSEKLIGLIENRDVRKNLIASVYKGKYYTMKYPDLSTGSDNVIVLRTAELFLIRAEANYQLDSIGNISSILADINTIRNRANLPSIIQSSTSSFADIIEKEKQIEFAFEGKRWFDLIRTKKAITRVPSVTKNFQMLFPIPLSEIIANPFIDQNDQNDGY
jgi:hypothetical protein